MRRVAIAVLLCAACGGKRSEPAPAADDAVVAKLADGLSAARQSADPIAGVIAAVQEVCGTRCPAPTLEASADFIAAQTMGESKARDQLLDEMDSLVLWRTPQAAATVPEATQVQPGRAWAVITVDAKGALTVARADRLLLTPSGLVVDREPARSVRDFVELEAALVALDPFEPDPSGAPPPEDGDDSRAAMDDQLERARALEALRALDGGAPVDGTFDGCALERRDLVGRKESEPARVVAALRAVRARPLILADADVPARAVLALLATIDGGALGVRAGGGTAVHAYAICDDVLEKPAEREQDVGSMTYGELIAALDAAAAASTPRLILRTIAP